MLQCSIIERGGWGIVAVIQIDADDVILIGENESYATKALGIGFIGMLYGEEVCPRCGVGR